MHRINDRAQMVRIAVALRARACKLRDEAGHNGRYDDGGAGALEAQVECFLAGLDGRLPASWQAYVEEQQRNDTRDRQEYERLKQKFGGNV